MSEETAPIPEVEVSDIVSAEVEPSGITHTLTVTRPGSTVVVTAGGLDTVHIAGMGGDRADLIKTATQENK
jgi:hypothetical protein